MARITNYGTLNVTPKGPGPAFASGRPASSPYVPPDPAKTPPLIRSFDWASQSGNFDLPAMYHLRPGELTDPRGIGPSRFRSENVSHPLAFTGTVTYYNQPTEPTQTTASVAPK